MHSKGFEVKDLKTNNIMISEDGHIRISQFKEISQESDIAFERDFYNLSLIVYEFLTGEEHPFKHLADP